MDTAKLARRLAYLQSNVNHWCPVVSSKEIKIVINQRCVELGVSMAEICASCDVSYRMVKKFWIETNDAVSRPKLRAEHIIKIADKVGVNIRTLVVVKPIEQMDRNEILKGLNFIRG